MTSSKTRLRGFWILLLGLLIAGCKNEPRVTTYRMGPVPGTPLKELHVKVTGRPDIQTKNGYSQLVLPAVKGRPVEVICDPTYSPWFASLSRNKELTFTLWQSKQVMSHTDEGEESFFWLSEIETIKDGPTLLYDAAICPLHEIRMRRCEIDISYGLPTKDFMDAYHGFSGGPGFVMGGCVVTDGSPTTTFGYKCDRCVAAYQRWSADWNTERLKSTSTGSKPN